MSYPIELLSLYKLDINKKYSKDYIFKKLVKKRCGRKYNLYNIDSKFLNIIMDYKLIDTNDTFYELFYLKSPKWKNHYKNGFTKKMIYDMIDSLKNISNELIKSAYFDFGKKINILVI